MIEKLKAEIFDLIYAQDELKIKFSELERLKQEKLRKLKEIEDGKNI